jgi:hypothetical protein
MMYTTLIKCLGTAFWTCFSLMAHFSLAQNAAPDQLLKVIRARYRSYLSLIERTVEHASTYGIGVSLPDIAATPHGLRVGEHFGDVSRAFVKLLDTHKTVACILRSTADNCQSFVHRQLCSEMVSQVQTFCYEEARMANSSIKQPSTSWIYNLPVQVEQTDESYQAAVTDALSSSF